jgi:hypothetical protein
MSAMRAIYAFEATSAVRAKAANGRRAVAQVAGAVLDPGLDSQRRAQGFMERSAVKSVR